MALLIIASILLSFSILIKKKINKDNSYHLKYLVQNMNAQIITLIMLSALIFFPIKQLGHLLGVLQILAFIYFYHHITSLLYGYRKKINFKHYVVLAIYSIIVILIIWKEALFTSKLSLIHINPALKTIASSRGFIYILVTKQLILLCYLFYLFLAVLKRTDATFLLKNKRHFKIWIYFYIFINSAALFIAPLIYFNPFEIINTDNISTLEIVFQLSSALILLNYILNPTILESLFQTKKIIKNKDHENNFERLYSYFKIEKQYLNTKNNIDNISNNTGLSTKEIRDCIKSVKHQNYNEFVNSFKIEHAITLLKDERYLKTHTLESIAISSGFNAPQAFYRVFKKTKNMTPSVYLKKYQESQASEGFI